MARCLEVILTALPRCWGETVHRVMEDAIGAAGWDPAGAGEAETGELEKKLGSVAAGRECIDLVDAMLLAKHHQYLGRRVTVRDVIDDPAGYQVENLSSGS